MENYSAGRSLARSVQWRCQYDSSHPAIPDLDNDVEFDIGAPGYRFELGNLSR